MQSQYVMKIIENQQLWRRNINIEIILSEKPIHGESESSESYHQRNENGERHRKRQPPA